MLYVDLGCVMCREGTPYSSAPQAVNTLFSYYEALFLQCVRTVRQFSELQRVNEYKEKEIVDGVWMKDLTPV